jgi:HAE1 family hydrophobic/amphiphilic exporter-1
MLSSRFLRPSAQAHHGKVYAFTDRFFQRMLEIYRIGLEWSVRHRRVTMLYSAVILLVSFVLFAKIPKGFLASEDIGQLSGSTEAQEGTSFDSMVEHQKAVAAVLAQDPNIEAFMSSAGGRGSGATNQGNLFIRLKPREERNLKPEGIIENLRPKLAKIPGIRVYLQNPPPIRVGGQVSRSAYQYALQGTDTEELYEHAQEMITRMRAMPELQDVTSDLQIRNPEVEVAIDRDRASALGVSVEQIEASLARAFGSGQITSIYAPTNEYLVILELLPEYRANPSALSLYIRSSTGALVPLSAIATLHEGIGPASINHMGNFLVTISFNLKRGIGPRRGHEGRALAGEAPHTISTSPGNRGV